MVLMVLMVGDVMLSLSPLFLFDLLSFLCSLLSSLISMCVNASGMQIAQISTKQMTSLEAITQSTKQMTSLEANFFKKFCIFKKQLACFIHISE